MENLTKPRTPVAWRRLFGSADFQAAYTYRGEDLGSTYTPEKTRFKVWAPTAERVELRLYRAGSDAQAPDSFWQQLPMQRQEDGTWERSVEVDLAGVYYTWLVTADGRTQETGDIYAKAAGVNGARSMVVDLAATDPEGWERDRRIALDAGRAPVIYEVHIKDFSNDPHSGIPEGWRGKYLAFTCKESGLDADASRPTCLAYLKKLGITHVHLLPLYDYGSVDEAAPGGEQFNWGYDPVNYNLPEGSYATDPFDGAVRIRECKRMIQALHQAGIGVIMDVVYNHTYSADSWFQRTVPWYYYRLWEDGSLSNGSACGNDTASERAMYRKFMIDSVCYWAREYHLDGFRFDLMGLHDVETMNEIRRALNALPGGEGILMYGEPWAAGETAMEEGFLQATKENAGLLDPGIAFFNDDTRDAVKGSVFEAEEPGFVNGKAGLAGRIRSSVLAWCDGAGGYEPRHPGQVISYVSAHDNYTLWDKLVLTSGRASGFSEPDEALLRENRFAAGVYLTCLGMAFFQAGEEGGRTKMGNANSYNAPPAVNQLDWRRIYAHEPLVDYYRGLIALRTHFSAFASRDREVLGRIRFLETPENAVAFHILGKGSGSAKKDWWQELVLVYNGTQETISVSLPQALPHEGRRWQLISDGTGFCWEETGRLGALAELGQELRAAGKAVTIVGR